MGFGLSLANIPACTFGCSVFTLPDKISELLVYFETSSQLNPNFLIFVSSPELMNLFYIYLDF